MAQSRDINVTRRLDGRYVATLRTGVGTRQYIYGQTEEQVREKIQERRSLWDLGVDEKITELTTGEVLKKWLISVKLSVRPTTWSTYESTVRLHLLSPLSIIPVKSLRGVQIDSVLCALSAHLSGYRVRYIRKVLSMSLGWGVRQGYLLSNPCLNVKAPSFKRREIQVWTPEETHRFLSVVNDEELGPFYLLAIGCGLRLGEILGLRWADLDLDDGTVSIQRTAKRVDRSWVYLPPKTDHGRRTIGLPDRVRDVLIRHRSKTKEIRGTDLVFTKPGRPGLPWHVGEIHMYYGWARKKAGVPHARFHDLRHLCATLMFRNGVHPKVVQETLGHSNISITLDLYTSSVPELQREAARGMGKFLG